MSDTQSTTAAPKSATPDTLTLIRPANVHPSAWEYRASMIHLAMTGHYPWCSEHNYDDEPGAPGWCEHEEHWPGVAKVMLGNGTRDGTVELMVELEVSLDSLSLNEATRLASLLSKAALTARTFNAPKEAGQ